MKANLKIGDIVKHLHLNDYGKVIEVAENKCRVLIIMGNNDKPIDVDNIHHIYADYISHVQLAEEEYTHKLSKYMQKVLEQ